LALALALIPQGLGLGLDLVTCVLGLGLGLGSQVLVNITGRVWGGVSPPQRGGVWGGGSTKYLNFYPEMARFCAFCNLQQ